MRACPQTDTQSVYDHGVSVYEHFLQLIDILENNIPAHSWKLPEWIFRYRKQILASLLPHETIKRYLIFHDCGKTICTVYDADGKRHFPDHAKHSSDLWLSLGGSEQEARLMRMDMMIHTMKADDIDEFVKNKEEAVTLLLAGLCEIHSNAKMFGGIDSQSFKIKYKQIDRRGRVICEMLFS